MLLMGSQTPGLESSRVPLVQDWTHRHMVYSHPTTIFQNLQLQQEPRYVQQVLHRNFIAPSGGNRQPIPSPVSLHLPGVNDLHRDWAEVMPAGGETLGDGNFPAKYAFNINAAPDCVHDYVVYTQTNASYGGTAVTIYALNNLYAGTCKTGTVPNVLWAYTFYTNFAGAVVGSPVLSLDGTQVAWMESKGPIMGTAATLHILKPYTGGGAGTLAAPKAPANSASAAAYRSCTPATGNAACLYSVSFADTNDDTTSSPYYDYSDDTMFVGDASGNLHVFTGVFNGAPAEKTSAGWPVAVHAGTALSSPVYDTNTAHAFVGDSSGRVSYVAVTGATFTGTLGGTTWTFTNATSITDAPIVDGTIGRVFVFANTSNGAEVGEADTSLGTHTGPVIVGASNTSPFHSGDFDNQYYSSDTGAGTGTGFLYVCGNNGAANHPALYQIAVTSGTISTGTPTSEFVAATASQECSPVTEFYNSTTSQDSEFFSVHGNATAGTACAGDGCLFAATLTPNGSAETVTISGAILASGGTSGVVVDNNSSASGAANVYYTWLGNSSPTYSCNGNTSGDACAVQVAQAGLGSSGAVVQSDSGDSGAATTQTSYFDSPAKPGDLILAFSKWDNLVTVTGITDNAGNTYTPIGTFTNVGTNDRIEAWYTLNPTGAPTSVTVTYSGKTASTSLLDIVEFSGLATSAPVDQTAVNTGTGTALSTGATPTTTDSNDTIVGLFATIGSSSPGYPYALGSGYSLIVTDTTSFIEYMSVTSTGSYTATATATNGSVTWGGRVIAFKNAVQN